MNGYVQMHFNKQQRELLFGGDWDWLNIDNIFSLTADDGSVPPQTAIKIIENKEPIQVWDGDDEAGNRIRFESIIDFPFFLLHVLKVFVATEFNEYFSAIPELLDDKKLLKTFTNIIDKLKSNKEFSLKFIKYLLKCRFLFDKYIIKREYKNEDTTGSWSLKELKVSGARSKKKPYYRDTYFGELNEWKTTYSPRTVTNLMLQSCLRVSYTSQKIMHWITELLKWLNVDDNLKKLSQFENQIEIIAQEPVIKFITDKDYMQGVNTPHIVLNYLDYLLWTKRSDDEYKGLNFDEFSFEFRNSVEHWYPQHPSSQSFDSWADVDKFGNLCIIQRNVNSKFSNLSPTSKKGTYHQMIEKGSLKMRVMSALTKDDTAWKETICDDHEGKMLKLFKVACNIA